MSIKFDRRQKAISAGIRPLERLMHNLSQSLDEPVLYVFEDGHKGFRYAYPDLRHFCLLKGVRAVSALNASAFLLRGGFTQEIAVLLRGLIECTTQIDYVLSGLVTDGVPKPAAEKYVAAFLADSRRGVGELAKKPKIRQEDVHKEIASETERILKDIAEDLPSFDTGKAMARVYATYSNYVHARYPEVMDMHGGTPGKFHMNGMRGTPKDCENLDVLEVYLTTAENCFAMMVHGLQLQKLVYADPLTSAWLQERHNKVASV